MQSLPTPDRLRQLFSYDPETGSLHWRVQRGCTRIGQPVRNRVGKHLRVGIDGRRFMAAQVAWAIHHGKWPVNFVEVVNGDPSDLRPCNLRASVRRRRA